MANPNERGERLSPDFTETMEFRSAVGSAVKAQVDALLPELLARLAEAKGAVGVPAPADGGDVNFASALALQLAELTGQGSGRIYVAPEVIERRRVAHERMIDILLELRASRDVPAYRLRNKVFLNLGAKFGEVLIDPAYRDNAKIMQVQEIDWPGVPNSSMEPINTAASLVFAAFSDSIGSEGKSTGPDRLFVLSDGAVLRGDMKQILGRRETGGDPADTNPDLPAAGIRRSDPAPKHLVQVLGTNTKPIEVS